MATSVWAQTPPNYGFDWVTIGDPGNRATIPSEVPGQPTLSVGAVSYDYRMTRSKLDTAQYAEFVNAYAPFWHGDVGTLMGDFVEGVRQGGQVVYQPIPGFEHCAARIEWQMAARYCNWLQNGKTNQAGAFESGVYDTSTFNFQPPNWSAQLTPSPGAKYWIPSYDEWVKAAHYDPNRYGPGQGGYWAYPDASDSPLTMGLPGEGGQTIGDLLWQTNPFLELGAWPLGQYPQVQSHYGLLDVSATVPDYTSHISNYNAALLSMGGSMAGSAVYWAFDRIDAFSGGPIWDSTVGALRIASAVPTPGLAGFCIVLTIGLGRRRRPWSAYV